MKHSPLFLLALLLCSCGPRQKNRESVSAELPVVCTVNYPLYYFAERIGGDLIQLEFPAPANVDPAYWVPDDDALSIYQNADLILANGADYAKWMHNGSLPSSRIFNTSSMVADNYIEVAQGASHSHGPEGDHVHMGFAFTTWLDFEIAISQAGAVKLALVNILPDKRDSFEENYRLLESELLDLHKTLLALARETEGEFFMGSHPVYQYLSKAYGLNIHSLHFEPGEMPSEDQWKEFDQLLKQYPSRMMLWEDEPLPEVKEILAEKGIQSLVFNPCGNQPAEGDFMEKMKRNITRLQSATGS
jgi:zinc transport system substrate-binding protein